ncbi:hypothetical protein TCSYLVIO_006597, partial [Trypanosoma cruzi]
MYEAKATKKLSSAIVVASSGCGLLFLGASFSAAPAASAVDHVAAALTPTEGQGRECGCVFRGHSNCHRRRRPSCSRVSTHRATPTTSSAKTFLQSTVQILICEWVCDEAAKKNEAQGGTSTQQEAHLDGSNTCSTASASTTTHSGSTHTNKKKNKQKKIKTRRQGVAVCVWRCGCLPALAAKKQNKRKEMCAPPHRPSSHAHTSRLPQRAVRRVPPHECSRRGAQGRRHERVGGCASGAVGRETHGTPH